jgi:hypothetical protein
VSFFGKENEPEVPVGSKPLRTYTYNRWGGAAVTVEAHFITFTHGHVNFWRVRADDQQDTLVLAESNAQVTGLKEVTP